MYPKDLVYYGAKRGVLHIDFSNVDTVIRDENGNRTGESLSPPVIDLAEFLKQYPKLNGLVIKGVAEVRGIELISTLKELVFLELESIQRGKNAPLIDLSILGELAQLQRLSLYNVDVYSFNPIGELKQLQKLSIAACSAQEEEITREEAAKSDIFAWLRSLQLKLRRKLPPHWYCHTISLKFLSGLKQLKQLKLSQMEIFDAAALSELRELEQLGFFSCKALDFGDEIALPALKLFECKNTNFKTILWLGNCKELKELYTHFSEVCGVRLHSSDFPPLSPALTTFISEMQPLTSVEFLRSCWQLSILEVSHNGRNWLDITALSELRGLRKVSLIDTGLVDIAPLSHHRNLQRLWLGGCRNLSDITALCEMESLNWLGLNSTDVTDISPLSSCVALEAIQLEWTRVRDFSPLASLPKLKRILGNDSYEYAQFAESQRALYSEAPADRVIAGC